ncbi:MAG: lysozyme inhibitor LprI family protein, partial [Paracoccaceae bacterium]
MRHMVLVLGLLPAAALAGEDMIARYGGLLEQCYGEADDRAARELCIGLLSGTCIREEDAGNSTLGIAQCNYSEGRFWDGLLNDEYRQSMVWAKSMDADEAVYFPEYANLANSLRAAQRAWITFRD